MFVGRIGFDLSGRRIIVERKGVRIMEPRIPKSTSGHLDRSGHDAVLIEAAGAEDVEEEERRVGFRLLRGLCRLLRQSPKVRPRDRP